ncbi:MAG: acetyl-CoA carboxylase biotin carboxyl carrier protein subunit [Bacteroidia bacterium]|nr:MAG: acetyl-CoA carboxylase biotin carboxyl carrier protein subunit [Bacteroidia bacterium]
MSYQVKLKDRVAHVEILSRQKEQLLVSVDGKEYALDFVKIGKGSYSILYQNKSFNVELIPINGIKKYDVNTFKNSFEVEIIDAESKYLASRKQAQESDDEAVITSPIPGKVVKLFVEKGDAVEAGQTILVISAMKMESEFKAPKAGVVSAVNVSEGQNVDSRQELVIIDFH